MGDWSGRVPEYTCGQRVKCTLGGVVSNNVYERLFKLWSMICKMVMDGVRNADDVADLLQTIVDGACLMNE